MNVDHIALTGNFVVSSMRVFHALSAGKMAQPPIVGGGPTDTEADPPPELDPEPEPELDPDPEPELDPDPDEPPLDVPPPSVPPGELPDPELPPHDITSAADARAIFCHIRR
jgi:hypothetical protein